VVVTALWAVIVAIVGSMASTKPSWHFFVDSSHLLFDGGIRHHHEVGELHLYATHPQFQFGPVSVVVAELIKLLSFGHSTEGASLFIAALSPPIMWLLLDTARRTHPDVSFRRLVPGATIACFLFPVVWSYLSIYSLHLDDALAITFTALALWAVACRRELVVGLALGLAVCSKPWAAAFLPLVLALPRGRRLRALGLSGAVIGGCWAPFVIGGQGTVSALGHFRIRNVRASALHALGVKDAFTPSWDRMTQIALGGALAGWCARSGRWPAAVMVALAVRIALDPSTHAYYTAGLVAVVLAWELLAARWRIPWLSVVTLVALAMPREWHWPWPIRGDVRLALCVVLVLVGLVSRGPHASTINRGDDDRAVVPT
jgi:hypothetical protein